MFSLKKDTFGLRRLRVPDFRGLLHALPVKTIHNMNDEKVSMPDEGWMCLPIVLHHDRKMGGTMGLKLETEPFLGHFLGLANQRIMAFLWDSAQQRNG